MSKLYSFLPAIVALQLFWCFIKPCCTQLNGSNCQLCDKSKKVSTFCQSFFVKYANNFVCLQNFAHPMFRSKLFKDAHLAKSLLVG